MKDAYQGDEQVDFGDGLRIALHGKLGLEFVSFSVGIEVARSEPEHPRAVDLAVIGDLDAEWEVAGGGELGEEGSDFQRYCRFPLGVVSLPDEGSRNLGVRDLKRGIQCGEGEEDEYPIPHAEEDQVEEV